MSLPSTTSSLPSVNEIAESSMMNTSTGSSLSGTSMGVGVGVGVGMASYSSSHTPFSTTPSPMTTSAATNQIPTQLIISNSANGITYRSQTNLTNYMHAPATSSNTSSNPMNNVNFSANTNGANISLQSNHNYNAALAAATSQLSQNCNFLNMSPSTSNFLPSLAGIRSHQMQTSTFTPSPSPLSSSPATTNSFLINSFQAANSASPETLLTSNTNGPVNSHLNSIINTNVNGSRHILNAGVVQTSPSTTTAIATGGQQLTLTLITTIPATSITTTTATATTTSTSMTEPTSAGVTSSNSSMQVAASTPTFQNSLPTSSLINSSVTSLISSANSNLNSGQTVIQQQPSTSAVSSSSAPITPAQNLSSTTRDWFTYVYKIENIEELIKNVDSLSPSSSASSHQNFIQSPIFSFTNHIVNVTNSSTNAASTTTSATTNNGNNSSGMNGPSFTSFTSSIPASTGTTSSQSIHTQSNVQNSMSSQTTFFHPNNGGSHSAAQSHNFSSNIFGSNQQSSSVINNSHTNFYNQSTESNTSPNNTNNNHAINTNGSSINTSTGVSATAPSTKQPSNWRLIFYPNGAGGDCKNFLSIFLKYLSDEPVKIQMMFSIVDNNNEDVYVKYTVNKFNKSNDWGFKQLIHKNAILFQKEKFLKSLSTGNNGGGGSLSVRVKMRLDDQKHDYIKKLNDNLHYCKLLSENFSQYYYNSANSNCNIANSLCSNSGAGTSSSVNSISNHKSEINGESSNNNTITNFKTVSLPSSSLGNASMNTHVNQQNAQIINIQTTPVTISPSSSFTPSSSMSTMTSLSSSSTLSSSFNGSSSLLSNSFCNLNSSLNSKNSSASPSTLALSNSLLNSNSSYFDILLLVRSPNLNESINNEASAVSPNTSNLFNSGANNLMCQNCFNIKNLEKVQNMYMRTLDSVSKPSRRSYSSLINSIANSSEELDVDYHYAMSNKKLKLLNGNPMNSTSLNQDAVSTLSAKNISNCEKCGNPNISSSTDVSSLQNLGQSCKIQTEFVEFRAHKCILAARSPVFKAMFNYRLKENLTNKLIIEDCKPEVVQAMLKYIYTAYLPDDIRTIAIDLYIAAEKYFIESLKIKCREYLVENLNTDSCIQVYILSEFYNDSMLRKQSLKFISENIDKVTQNSDWNEFMLAYPQFFTNAFIRLCKKDF